MHWWFSVKTWVKISYHIWNLGYADYLCLCRFCPRNSVGTDTGHPDKEENIRTDMPWQP